MNPFPTRNLNHQKSGEGYGSGNEESSIEAIRFKSLVSTVRGFREKFKLGARRKWFFRRLIQSGGSGGLADLWRVRTEL